MSWYGDYDWMGNNAFGWLLRSYLRVRGALMGVAWVIICISLYQVESYGLFDGTFVYAPLTLLLTALSISASSAGSKQHSLTWSLNECFLTHTDQWMLDIRDSIIKPLWKWIMFYINYNITIVFTYSVVPVVLDIVLHYGFDMYPEHVILPMPFSQLIKDKCSWDANYYAVTVLNLWLLSELVCILQGFLVNYGSLAVFYLTELRIFNGKIKLLELSGPQNEIDNQLQHIISCHNVLIKLNLDLKAAFGLPCAFQALFTSMTMTLVLFTMMINRNVLLLVGYGSGLVFYFLSALVYCFIGQLLETQSEEIEWALYDLPWYKFRPAVRRDLLMLMRQARSPLIIDYRGKSKMNLDTFMQIIRSAYSYFTLLQSMIE
ncbi:7tm Odorant receptor [Nesidiocoris tenuis]|nr:7tm Odorant receptor [Nesidiocoris tenuis]